MSQIHMPHTVVRGWGCKMNWYSLKLTMFKIFRKMLDIKREHPIHNQGEEIICALL